MESKHIVTAEAVRAGHPDKLCDQIADAILDAHLKQDPLARVAVEVFVTDSKLLVAGEVTSKAKVSYKKIVWETLGRLRYAKADLCSDPNGHVDVEVRIHEQSRDIADAVDGDGELGAGDQGIMVGYATDETPEMLPLPVVLAQCICKELDRMQPTVSWMGADGKAQVSVVYENGKPAYVDTIVISVQHSAGICPDCLSEAIVRGMVMKCIPMELIRPKTDLLVNPSGSFVLGGPVADTGLTGRKLAVDQYGPVAHIGGGALSGKDPTKVDRSGAYMARYIAKNIVAAGLATRCEVQIAYAIGRSEPVSVSVETFSTSAVNSSTLAQCVRRVFDLRPDAIIKKLDLRKPIYAPLAVYGHYGRPELNLPWERTDRNDALYAEVLRVLLN